jgi:stress-induced-phosphoprotein 1
MTKTTLSSLIGWSPILIFIRSASFFNLHKFDQALSDAENCIKIKGDWAKGYLRKGMALAGLEKKEEAKVVYEEGLKLEPTNQQLKDGLAQCNAPAGGGGFGGMFGGDAMQKLMGNERIAKYFESSEFKAKFEMCQSNPQFLAQLMQTDPRFMDVFSTLTGLDMNKMQEEQMKHKEG